MKITENIAYGVYAEELLDIYAPEEKTENVFLYFHGGGFKRGDKSTALKFAKYLTDNKRRNTKNYTKKHGGMYRLVHSLVVVCTVATRQDNARTYRHTQKQIQKKIGNRTCSAYRSHGIAATPTAYHYEVCRIVKKLNHCC